LHIPHHIASATGTIFGVLSAPTNIAKMFGLRPAWSLHTNLPQNAHTACAWLSHSQHFIPEPPDILII
jgi:hypothetical protein